MFILVSVGSLQRESCRRVHSRSREITRTRLGVVWFIRVCVASLGSAWGWSSSFWFSWVYQSGPRCHRVYSSSCGCTPARLGVVGFIRVLVVFFVGALGSSCSFEFASGAPKSHSGSRGFTRALLGVPGFIRFHVRSLVRSLCSLGFTSYPPKCLRVHWG